MGKKGRKTRWRKLPILIGNGRAPAACSDGLNEVEEEQDDVKPQPPTNNVTKTTFNEDEYTKITTPRQDMLFKKGYLGKKKSIAVTPPQDSLETQSADSIESDQYICEEQIQPQYIYPNTGYIDHTGVYYINNSYEVYDPYTGNVTVIVGPGYPTGPHTGVLTAVPCQPVPLQPLEWFNPSIPQPHPAYSVPVYPSRKKRNSIDSQNCSGQSSETTCPPGSPQEPLEGCEASMYPPQYVYPGYMFGAPMYNMNGVTVQGVVPQSAPLPPPADQAKRRKKRRRRRRGGVTDEGSESSCEDMLSCDASGVTENHSGASSDTAPGSSSSKTNSDSGIHTDPTPLSGANSPRLPIDEPYFNIETNGNEEVEDEEEVEVVNYQQQQQQQQQQEGEVIENEQEGSERLSLNVEEKQEEIKEGESLSNEEIVGNDDVKEEVEETIIVVESSENSKEDEPKFTQEVNSEPSIPEDSFTNIPNEEASIIIAEEHNEDIQLNLKEELPEDNIQVCLEKEEEVIEKEEQQNVTVEEGLITKIVENEIDIVTERLSEQTIREGSSERPITEAVTKWLRSQGSAAVRVTNSSSTSSDSEDEGIEEGEDVLEQKLSSSLSSSTSSLAGQKNGQGNPFLASSPSNDNRTRVAIYDCTQIEEDIETWAKKYDKLCNAKHSVKKYYSLGTSINNNNINNNNNNERGAGAPQPAVVLKTAMHLGAQAGPFPCGICCILQ